MVRDIHRKEVMSFFAAVPISSVGLGFAWIEVHGVMRIYSRSSRLMFLSALGWGVLFRVSSGVCSVFIGRLSGSLDLCDVIWLFAALQK